MDLNGRTALLTGATGGIGRAIAQAMAERGAKVVLSARNREALDGLAAELAGDGHRVLPAELGEPGAGERLAEDAGAVDLLVANAGLPGTGRLETFTAEELQRALRVNLEAPMLMSRVLAPGMVERGEGHLVFIASIAGKAASPRSMVYNATKFGLRGFAFGLRADLAGSGVGVSVVSPGFIRDAGMFADSGAKTPPGMGTSTPEEVAAGVLKAIDRDRIEVVVAPIRQRALGHIAMASPSIAYRSQRGRAGKKAADSVASGQKDKR